MLLSSKEIIQCRTDPAADRLTDAKMRMPPPGAFLSVVDGRLRPDKENRDAFEGGTPVATFDANKFKRDLQAATEGRSR
jgi:hypothetical protein